VSANVGPTIIGNVTNKRSLDPFLVDVWRFVRGDTTIADFEQWVYANNAEVELRLGRDRSLQVFSSSYRSSEAVAQVRGVFRAYALATQPLSCQCITLADLSVVDMGVDAGPVLASIAERRSRGEPWWWLWCGECTNCGDWWLVGQEERHNDVFCLHRLNDAEVHRLVETNEWPPYFDAYESLLRLGRDTGRRVEFVDPEQASSLRWTVTDLAKARPGIRVSEIAALLNVDPGVARVLAQRAIRNDGARIEFDGE
jgi:hypothetical protein